ncbi:MAG: integrase family protein [Firmicutes bacterium]|nr:integrase family protein [Bacillota bacterium]
MPAKVAQISATTWRLTVSDGYDQLGKQVLHRKVVEATSKRQADKFWTLYAAEIANGKKASSGKMTLSQFYAYWKKNNFDEERQKTTLSHYDFLFRRIETALGGLRLDKIEPRHILDFKANLEKAGIKNDPNAGRRKKPKVNTPGDQDKLSGNTVKKHLTLLDNMFHSAVKWNMANTNPCKNITMPKVDAKKPDIYDRDTLGLFLYHLQSEPIKYQVMVYLALAGSLRREEIFGLRTPDDIDLKGCTVSIVEANVYIPGEIVIKPPKNKSSARPVSLPPSTMALIEAYQGIRNDHKANVGDDDWTESGKLFTQWNGTPAHPHSFNTWIKKFLVKHDLPHITPHTLRHMTGTYLSLAGTDPATIAAKMGHAKITTTLGTYVHAVPAAEKETAKTIDTYLQGALNDAEKKAKKRAIN